MATYKDIKRQIADLEKKAAEVRKVEVAKVIAAIQKQIEEYELTAADLFKGAAKVSSGKVAKKGAKSVNPPKYMDPKSGKTWTGFGKAPTWIADAVKKGKKDDFLIAKVEAQRAGKAPAAPQATKAVAGKTAKATAKPTVKATAAKKVADKPAKSAKPIKPAKAPTAKTPRVTTKPATPKTVAPKPAAPLQPVAAEPAAMAEVSAGATPA